MARAANGRFEKGSDTAGPGREKGGHNKTTRILKDAMLLAAEECGDLSGIPREDLSQEGVERAKDGLVGLFALGGQVRTESVFAHPRQAHPCSDEGRYIHPGYLSFIRRNTTRHRATWIEHAKFFQLLLEAHQVKEREFKAGERHDSVDSNVAVVNGSAVCCDRDAPHQKDRASE